MDDGYINCAHIEHIQHNICAITVNIRNQFKHTLNI